MADVPQATISRWEAGVTRVIDLDVLDKLARALQLKSATQLLTGKPD